MRSLQTASYLPRLRTWSNRSEMIILESASHLGRRGISKNKVKIFVAMSSYALIHWLWAYQ